MNPQLQKILDDRKKKLSVVSHIGPTKSCTFFTILWFFFAGIILWEEPYNAGLIKSFIAESSIIKFFLEDNLT